MTAVRELERPVAAPPRVPACQAMIPVYLDPDCLPVMIPCPEPAEGLFAARCECGLHEGWAWLCRWCSQALGRNGCLDCLQGDGSSHTCLLTVTPASARGDGRG